MGAIYDSIQSLRHNLPPGVTLVAVTKTRTPGEIMEAYDAGLRIFGENRVRDLATRKASLPDDINWHLIGHLQTNKVKEAVASASVIESVDSLRLLRMIDEEAMKQGKTVDCLLQVRIAREESKTGFTPDELDRTEWTKVADSLMAARLCGIMGIATFTDDNDAVRNEFRLLADLFRRTRERCFAGSRTFTQLSMGMSGDWQLAVQEGSTMIRVGTLIFGNRTAK